MLKPNITPLFCLAKHKLFFPLLSTAKFSNSIYQKRISELLDNNEEDEHEFDLSAEKFDPFIDLTSNKFSQMESSVSNGLIKKIENVLKTTNLKVEEKLKSIFQVIEENHNEIDSVETLIRITSVISSFNKGVIPQSYISDLKPKIISLLKISTPKEYCTLMRSLATLKIKDQQILEVFIELLNSQLVHFSFEDYLNLLYAIIKMKNYNELITLDIYNKSQKMLFTYLESNISKKNLVNLVWCLISLEERNRLIYEKVLELLNDKANLLNSSEISQYLWCISKLRSFFSKEDYLFCQKIINFEQIILNLNKVIDKMNLNELNMTVWGLVKLEYKLENDLKEKFRHNLNYLINRTSNLPLIQLSGSLTTVSILNFDDKPFFFMIIRKINNKIIKLKQNELIPIINCLKYIPKDPRNQNIFNQIETFMKINCDALDHNSLIFIMKHYPKTLKSTIELLVFEIIMKKINLFTIKEIVFLFSSFEKLYKILKPEYVEQILSIILPKISEIEIKDLSQIVKHFGYLHFFSKNGNDLIAYAEKVILNLLDTNNDIFFKKPDEIIFLMIGCSEYKWESKNLWNSIEMNLFKIFYKLSDESQLKILKFSNKCLSNDFLIHTQQIVKKKLKNYSNLLFVNFLREIEKINVVALDEMIWDSVEKEIMKRLENNIIDYQILSLLLVTMKTHKAGSNKFWTEILKKVQEKLEKDNIKINSIQSRACFCFLLQAFRKNEKLSEKFGNFILPSILELTNQNLVLTEELYEIAVSFYKMKIADDQLWYNLEVNFIKNYKKMSFPKIWGILTSFAKIKKGSKVFWENINSWLLEKQNQINEFFIPALLNIIENNASFDRMIWSKLLFQNIESSTKNPIKFIKYMNELKKNESLIDDLKQFDCLKILQGWNENIRYNFEDEIKRKEIDNILLSLLNLDDQK